MVTNLYSSLGIVRIIITLSCNYSFILHIIRSIMSSKKYQQLQINLTTVSDKQREAKRLELLSLSEHNLANKHNNKPWRTINNY